MKTKHILTAIAIALATTTSCDNLLDVKNPSNIYGEGYWSTKGELPYRNLHHFPVMLQFP